MCDLVPINAGEDFAETAGFEPATRGFGDRCSGHLSYVPVRVMQLPCVSGGKQKETGPGL